MTQPARPVVGHTLGKHGEKLVRIETKLGIPDKNGGGEWVS